MDDVLAKFMRGLDVQQPDWWITFADDQDVRHYARETWTWEGKPADPAHISRVRDSMRRSVASRLMLGCRAAITAGLVQEANAAS